MSQNTQAGPVPTLGSASNVPADMLALAASLGPQLCPPFATVAERDAAATATAFKVCTVGDNLFLLRSGTWVRMGGAGGILGSWDTTAQTDAPNTTFVPVSNWQKNVTVDSPRTLQLIMSCTLNASAAGLIPDVICYINGTISARVSQVLPAAGGAGQMIPNAAGIAVPVPAGTVNITAQLRCKFGAGTVSIFTGGTLQLIDVGSA